MILHLAANKKVDAHYRGFTIHSDQPVTIGGDNTAPSPFELFLASIGMCTGFYVLAFCQSRSIPTDNIKITQTVIRNDATHIVEKIIIDINLAAGLSGKIQSRGYKDCSILFGQKVSGCASRNSNINKELTIVNL